MQYTLISLHAPDSKLFRTGASKVLRDMGGLDKKYCDKVVEDVRVGVQRKVILSAAIGPADLKMLAVFFEMEMSAYVPAMSIIGDATAKQLANSRKAATQLKLWAVHYCARNERTMEFALVLASTEHKAIKAITNQIRTDGGVSADEMEPPFSDGLILTTTTTD